MEELPPCVSVRKIERGHVILVAQHGHDELAHWLEHDPNGLRSALANGTRIGSLFSNPATSEKEREQVRFLLWLAQEIERFPSVLSVSWWEMDFQKAFCSICNPAKRPAWRPVYRFQYPENLSSEEFLGMFTQLRIDIAMPIKGTDVMQCIPSHRYATRVTIIDPGPRYLEKQLVWEPVYRERKSGSLSLSVNPGESAYAPSRSILERCGMWGSAHLEQGIFHLYSDEMANCLKSLWRHRWVEDQGHFPNLQSTPLREVHFGFRKRADGQWEIVLTGLRYY